MGKRQELEKLERSVLRSERLLYTQSQVVSELERGGSDESARSARALLRAFQATHRKQLAQRDWLRRKLGWYAEREGWRLR